MIDIDAPPVPAAAAGPSVAARRRRFAYRALPYLAVAALAGLGGGLVALNLVAPDAATPVVTRQIAFRGDGAARVLTGVWTRAETISGVTTTGPTAYVDPVGAAMTVITRPGQASSCQIVVDGVVVDEAFASDGGVAVCFWVPRG